LEHKVPIFQHHYWKKDTFAYISITINWNIKHNAFYHWKTPNCLLSDPINSSY